MPLIVKALPREPQWQHAYRAVRQAEEAFEQALGRAADLLRAHVDPARVRAELEAGRAAWIGDLPWDEAFARTLADHIEPVIADALRRSAVAELARLGLRLRFDLDNPYSVPWLRAYGGRRITEITEETRRAILAIIEQGFRDGFPPDVMARRIRSLIGLTERDARAVMRYWQTLTEEATLSSREVDRLADAYARRLLRRRALTIARTETIAAEANGLHHSWLVARDAGFVDPAARRVWIAAMESPRTCQICLDLDGREVGLDEPWTSRFVGSVMTPPAHPNCRCSMALVTRV